MEDLRNSAVAGLNQHVLGQNSRNPKADSDKSDNSGIAGNPGKKRSKFGSVKTEVNGIVFDSKKEAFRYQQLLDLQKKGKIGMLELQVEYPIHVEGKLVTWYIADFRYIEAETGKTVVEDVKSPVTRKTRVYRLKKKMMLAIYQIEIQEY